MHRAAFMQELKQMQFQTAYEGWQSRRLSQAEAASLLGISERSFRRYRDRYETEGEAGLQDRRLSTPSPRRAGSSEVSRLLADYKANHRDWTVRHYYSFYTRQGGTRSYSFVKNTLQQAGYVTRSKGKGKHRLKRERKPLPGMMIHQDGSKHEWIAGQYHDLIVTMDDATNEHYSMFLVEEEGTQSSLRGVQEVIEKKGLFCSIYTDRGSHYWTTDTAGGKVNKHNLTQFGRAMKELRVEMIPAYSPEARGRSERMFGTHQGRLPRELALHGITTIEAANEYIQKVYLPHHNQEFSRKAPEEGAAFVPWPGGNLEDYLCEKHSRTVRNDNCVSFNGVILQIPSDTYRHHYVKSEVTVHVYLDNTMAIFHGPRKLAEYGQGGELISHQNKLAA